VARRIINVVLVIILVLISWFGLGPVFFADGTGSEKFNTLMLLSFFYLLIFAIMYYVNRHMRKSKDE